MKENTFILCQRLLKLVQATRAGAEVVDIEYFGNNHTDDAHVDITWASGSTKRVDVTADSGIAMIKDVLEHIT